MSGNFFVGRITVSLGRGTHEEQHLLVAVMRDTLMHTPAVSSTLRRQHPYTKAMQATDVTREARLNALFISWHESESSLVARLP
jgi:hypothetical protein